MPPASSSIPTYLPDNETLYRGLASILIAGDTGNQQSGFSVLDREYNEHSSTYPSEVVKCKMGDGKILQLHCKYSIELEPKGHRKGIIHEARVYQNILQVSTSETPRFYGTYNDLRMGNTWLVLEHIDNALSASRSENGLLHAARWLGNFHRENTKHLTAYPILEKYDEKYFLKWARQTRSFISSSQNNLKWLDDLCDRYEGLINLLLSAEQTIIHGEFYPSNILVKGKVVYPVDWESAAVSAGELDLAALTEGWPASISEPCITEYQNYRWPKHPPACFRRTLSVARIHWQLRFLADNPKWVKQKKMPCRLKAIMQEGEWLGLL